MKKMKKIFLTVLMGALVSLTSCSDETFDPVASNSTINLTAPSGGTFTLNINNENETATTVKWTSADFGFNAAVTYSMQAVKANQSFNSNPGSYPLGTYNSSNLNLEKIMTVKELNNLILSANGIIGVSEQFKIRIVGKPSTQLTSSNNAVVAISNEVTITVNPYDAFANFNKIYVPGSYQSASGYGNDWSPDHANVGKLFSPNNDGQYAGYIHMNDASPLFKITEGPSWAVNYGYGSNNGDFTVTTTSQTKTVSPGASNLQGSGVGTYWIKADLSGSTKTVTAQKMDYGLIGAFNGWGNDVDFTYNPTTRVWEKVVTLSPGGMLLRGNDNWDFKMGALSGSASDANLVANVPIKIKEGGADIQVQVSGTYKVIVDLNNSANYTLKIIPN